LLASPNDPTSIALAIRYLLDHPSEGSRMAEAARRLVQENFLPELLGRELSETYACALESTPSLRPAPFVEQAAFAESK
jgi:glycosyltransferase involved in cell wall biosynthesis